ncbi:MAG: chorismate synthase [Halarsenatibacteraceae bacterium]
MFDYITAGESHGPEITAIIKDLPAGLEINLDNINKQLKRRQQGYGRGGRMDIEKDKLNITSGLREGITLGSPLAMNIKNKDWANWEDIMTVTEKGDQKKIKAKRVSTPRPGHADLPGGIKFNQTDLRNILERASARETAIRTAVGSIAREFIAEFAVEIFSHVTQIGTVKAPDWQTVKEEKNLNSSAEIREYFSQVEASPVRTGSKKAESAMIDLIDKWKEAGDSVGGICEVIVTGLPPGLGSHTHHDLKLEGQLAAELIAIQAIKGIEFGGGFKLAEEPGSQVHDEIFYDHRKNKFYRKTNNSGGLEGGITTGEELIIRLPMKPIPTLSKPLKTVNLDSKEPATAAKERSDNCAVPSASIVAEAVTAIVLAKSFSKKFGGDSIKEIKSNYNNYLEQIKNY